MPEHLSPNGTGRDDGNKAIPNHMLCMVGNGKPLLKSCEGNFRDSRVSLGVNTDSKAST